MKLLYILKQEKFVVFIWKQTNIVAMIKTEGTTIGLS